jgi:heme-degrading monooxygenase HmoA
MPGAFRRRGRPALRDEGKERVERLIPGRVCVQRKATSTSPIPSRRPGSWSWGAKATCNALATRFADTPEPPYVAVIFTLTRTEGDHGYAAMAESMNELEPKQPGFLGVEPAREGVGITVSYWVDHAAARAWKEVDAHSVAQRRGREVWYQGYRVRIAAVDRDYSMTSSLFGSQDGMATPRDATGSDRRRQ